MYQPKVKAGSITNLTDARYFAAHEVTWMGFCLDESSDRYVPPALLNAIREWVDGPQIVGEFGFAEATDIQTVAHTLRLNAVQVEHLLPLHEVAALEGLIVFKEIVVERGMMASSLPATLRDFAPYVTYFHLDFEKNGITWQDLQNGRVLSVETLQQLSQQYPLILAMDFTPSSLSEIIETVRPAGISFQGGEEEKIGVKSFDQLDDLFAVLPK